MDPGDPNAERFYQRQRGRRAIVALEYDGPAWRAWLEGFERGVPVDRSVVVSSFSHLIPVDADLRADSLRARHPDRAGVVIVPAVVAIVLNPEFSYQGTEQPPQISGRIEQMPVFIHVPRRFSDFYHRLDKGQVGREVSYRVHLRYGALLEPWVSAIDLTGGR